MGRGNLLIEYKKNTLNKKKGFPNNDHRSRKAYEEERAKLDSEYITINF